MTRPKVKPYTLRDVQELTRDAIRRASQRHLHWDALENLYRYGQTFGPQAMTTANDEYGRLVVAAGMSVGQANLALPATNIILESVVAQPPQHLCEPLSGGEGAEASARVAQAVLRYFWRRSRGTLTLRDMAQDMVVLGGGFGKVGWLNLSHDEDRDEDEVVDQLAKLIEADRLMAQLEDREPQPVDELAEMVPLATSVVDADEPFFEYVSPFDLFVPLDARRLHEARWVCQRLTLPIDEIRAHPAFENTKHVVPDSIGRGDDATGHREGTARRGKDGAEVPPEGVGAFETATIYEFYDMRTRRLTVCQLDAAKPLLHDELPYTHRHSPYVHMRNYSDGGKEFWSFGELESIAGLHAMFNEFTEEQLDNARRSGNKYVANGRFMSPELRELVETDQPDVLAVLNNLPDGVTIGEVIQSFPRQALPDEVYSARDTAHGLMRETMGLNDFQTGGVGADRMAATTAAVVDGIATLRAQGKVRQVEEAASHSGNLMLLLAQEFMGQERAIRVAGPEGVAWPVVSADDIRGEFLVSVEGGSTQAVNPATRQQRALDKLQVILPALSAAGFDPEPALRSAIRDLGMDPDQLLVRAQPQEGGAPPEPPPSGFGAPPSPTIPQEELGGPPVPAAVEGGLAL